MLPKNLPLILGRIDFERTIISNFQIYEKYYRNVKLNDNGYY